MRDYLPIPFCSYCNGGPIIREYIFTNVNSSPSEVCDLITLSNPEYCQNIDVYIGKSLSTTRTEFVNKRIAITKEKLKRSRFSMAEKQGCCSNEGPTSVVHLLYRLRLRSNYDNPDMFLYGDSNETALARYNDFNLLTSVIIAGLETLLEKAIGSAGIASLQSDIP